MKELVYGPLNKSLFTQELELVAKCLIHQDNKTKIDIIYASSNHNELHAKIGNIDINLTTLLKKSNFSHLDLSQSDSYVFQKKSSMSYWSHTHHALTPSELSVIQSYTGSYYSIINSLLYGKIAQYWYPAADYVKDAIINTCMLGSGLKKIMPDIGVHKPTYRGEHSTPDHEINERIKLIDDGGGITESKAFLSTTLNYSTAKNFGWNNCEIHFDDSYGKKIYDLSNFPSEQEYLLPPSQILWESYEKKGDKIVFHAKVVEPLIEGKDATTQEDLLTFKKLVKWATEQGINTDFITDHLLSQISDKAISSSSPIKLDDCISFEQHTDFATTYPLHSLEQIFPPPLHFAPVIEVMG